MRTGAVRTGAVTDKRELFPLSPQGPDGSCRLTGESIT